MTYHTLSKSLIATGMAMVALITVVTTGYAAPRERNGFDLTDCSIPADQIKGGGPPRDGIPALTKPATISSENASYLNDNDQVIGVAYMFWFAWKSVYPQEDVFTAED